MRFLPITFEKSDPDFVDVALATPHGIPRIIIIYARLPFEATYVIPMFRSDLEDPTAA